MPSFSFSPTDSGPINPLLDYASTVDSAQKMQGGRIQNQLAGLNLDNAQMQNDIQHAVQPLQLAGQVQTSQDMLNALSAARNTAPPPNALSGMGPQSSAAPTPAEPVSQFAQQLGASESGNNPGRTNAQGYSGQFQFGSPRLASLGLYQPGANETGADGKWNGQWTGQFNIPGFPGVKTQAQFLANPDAQRAAFGVHVADIDGAIANTPGADRLDPNGLRWTAHLGGNGGMRKFAASMLGGDAYNPGDNPNSQGGGTHLSEYYRRGVAGGAAALQAAHGHPDGPLPQYASNSNPNVASDVSSDPGFAGRTLTSQAGMQPDDAGQGAPQQYAANTRGGAVGNDASGPSGPSAAAAAAAQAARIKMIQNNAFFQSGGKGLDSIAKLQNSLDSMAKEGVVVLPGGQVGVLPGAAAGKQIMSQADAQGKVQPAVDQAAAIAMNAQQIKRNDPVKLSPGETFGTEQAALNRASGNPDGLLTVAGGRGTPVKGPNGEQGVYDNATGHTHWISGADTRPGVDKIATADYEQIAPLAKQSQTLEGTIQKTIEARNAAAEVPTGADADARAARANWIKTYLPGGDKLIDSGVLQDPTKAQVAKKLLFGLATANEAAYGGSGGLGITQKFEGANPNLDMTGEGIRQMANLQAVTAMANKDYTQGKLSHITDQTTAHFQGGTSDSYLSAGQYDKNWLSQNNSNTYLAAVNAMNGKPFDEWSKGLSQADAGRALGVIARIDPTATVMGRKGVLPVNGFVPTSRTNPAGTSSR